MNDIRVTEQFSTMSKKRSTKASSSSSSTTSHPTSKKQKTKTAQVAWSLIWSKYLFIVNRHGPDIAGNGQNSIYDLIVQVTRKELTNTFHDIDPCQAMYDAKVKHNTLTGTDAENALKCSWRWSPQSNKARQHLAKHYNDALPRPKYPSFSEAKKDQKRLVKKGPTNAFQAGWRWFPVPAPKTKSHNMRWYPPTSVALEMKAANVEGVTFKKCTHLDIEFVTSPMIVKYYKSCGVELTDVDTGKAKKK